MTYPSNKRISIQPAGDFKSQTMQPEQRTSSWGTDFKHLIVTGPQME